MKGGFLYFKLASSRLREDNSAVFDVQKLFVGKRECNSRFKDLGKFARLIACIIVNIYSCYVINWLIEISGLLFAFLSFYNRIDAFFEFSLFLSLSLFNRNEFNLLNKFSIKTTGQKQVHAFRARWTGLIMAARNSDQ